MCRCGFSGGGGGGPSGSGTAGFIPVWTAATVLGDSQLQQAVLGAFTAVGLGVAPTADFHVQRSRAGANTEILVRNPNAAANSNAFFRAQANGGIAAGDVGYIFDQGDGATFRLLALDVSDGRVKLINGQTLAGTALMTWDVATSRVSVSPQGLGPSAWSFEVRANQNSAVQAGVINEATLAAAAGAQFNISVTPSGADPVLLFNVAGVKDWTVGIDNSVGDAFNISEGSAPGANDSFRIAAGGETSVLRGNFLVQRAFASDTVESLSENTDAGAFSSARFHAKTAGASGHVWTWYEAGGTHLSFGMNGNDGHAVITGGNSPTSTPLLDLDPNAVEGQAYQDIFTVGNGGAGDTSRLRYDGYHTTTPADPAADQADTFVFDDGLETSFVVRYNDAGTVREGRISLGGGVLGAFWDILNAAGSPYTLSPLDMGNYAVDLSGGDVVVNLPPISSETDSRILIFKISTPGGLGDELTINADAGDPNSIDGLSSRTLSLQYDFVRLDCDAGSNAWWET